MHSLATTSDPHVTGCTRVYTWSQNLLEHSGMTHALINNTVSIFIVRVELCYLSSHAQREPLSLLLLATAASIIVAKASIIKMADLKQTLLNLSIVKNLYITVLSMIRYYL